ncbi:hypothetical protein [Methylobacterium sp. 092160098-2]|uniref:hypothetical protein n=1 Tax=Methylobacterium sp. 092160098-2 TaxID=3025129 RepID=UPI002381C4E9|nr:hypothetical protein [Methylobacterium sp. 092160098-2]MDE4914025.1 hypothetical protein [Methylobacterium sp. 092160098-2]
MRLPLLVARSCAATVAAALVGAHASAAVPTLLFGASLRDFAVMSASTYLPALGVAICAAPLVANGLREDGFGRLAWQCALVATMMIAGSELRWMWMLDLPLSPPLVWNVVFKALLRGFPGGLAAAGAIVLVLRLLPSVRPGVPA